MRAPVQRRGLQFSEHRALLTLGDLSVGVLAVTAALWLWTITAGVRFPEALAARAGWFAAAVVWSLGLHPARHPRRALSIPATIRTVLQLAAFLLVAYLGIYFYAPRDSMPRLLALYFLWEAVLLTSAWRIGYAWLFTHGPWRRRVLVAGAGPAGQAIAEALDADPASGLMVVGFVAAGSHDSRPGVLPIVGGYERLPDAALERGVGQVILADPLDAGEQVERLLACEEAGVNVVPMAVVYEQVFGRVPVAHVEPAWLFTSYAEAVSVIDASRFSKRLLDLVGAVAGALALAVVSPVVAAAIWLDSGRPIFYRQVRSGRGGRPFLLTKFRTMVPDAESDGVPRWSQQSDPRVTRVGRWLRSTRLDELPNVLSVLRGDMSLVGPRPERPEIVAELERRIPLYRARLIAPPGLTGWAQINHPYGDSVEDAFAKLEYDLYYLKYRSLLFDAWVLLSTVRTVFTMRGR